MLPPHGIAVAPLGQAVAAPFTMGQLADLGAHVAIDPMRAYTWR